MGPSASQMEPGPPKIVEAALAILLPPQCRESVLGDLHERFVSRRQYIGNAIVTVPLVILSQVRRVTDAGLLLLEALAVYLSFCVSARFCNGGIFLGTPNVYLRVALPVLPALVALMVADVYARGEQRAIKGPASAFSAIWLQFVMTAHSADWAVPVQVVLFASCAGIGTAVALRALFARANNRTAGAG
jgi:hypothetical protein